MKTDLKNLMERENIAALWILGGAASNPDMNYFTGSVHVSAADLILVAGEEPVLFCNAMEREEAASTGLKTINVAKYEFQKLLEETGGNLLKAQALERQQMFQELGVTAGRVAVSGRTEIGWVIGMLRYMEELMPGMDFFGQGGLSILLEARATKDEAEISRIRKMGKITTTVVGQVASYLQNCQVRGDEVLLDEDGKPVTVGGVKRKINLWLAENGLDNPEGCIFAIGRDAGIPHSAGNPEDQIRLGKTIIFDIYPQEGGGGYFYDFTRTWCLGYAPPEEARVYQDVRQVYQTIMGELTAGQYAPEYQDRTCELFEDLGHKTIRQDSQLLSGYVHSLGHGLGLNVHERPWFGKGASQQDRLDPGSVVTIEPGLYYPDRGLGCRIEDSVWVRPDGKMEILADYPYDLVLPVNGWNA